LSNEAGRQMRALLNRWATRSRSSSHWEVVVDVCTGDLADSYPSLALTRINNLALRAAGPLIPLVVEAVVRLWNRPTMQHDICRRLWSWLGDPSQPAFAVGLRSLEILGADTVRVAFAHRSGADPVLSTAVANIVMKPDQTEAHREVLYSWFDIAVLDEEFGSWLTSVVAAAIPGLGSARRVAGVRTFADGWETRCPGSGQALLRERLVDRISRADTTILGWTMAADRMDDLP
jgi:hypothetical protein